MNDFYDDDDIADAFLGRFRTILAATALYILMATIQGLSGTCLLRLAAALIERYFPGEKVLISSPTWGNHKNIFNDAKVPWSEYRYYDPKTIGLDFEGMIADIKVCFALIILCLKGLVMKIFGERIANFMRKAWRIGADNPAKVVHGLKVGLALSIVSVFYYMRPLYEGVGGNAMLAIMTVVVVFESNVGATFYKCVNRVVATILAGSLGIGVHWVATQAGKAEPFVIGCSVFLFAFTATYSRFVPAFKARFDYGAMIFILTLSFVSIDAYRVDKLVDVAQRRVATIAIGTSICLIITVFLCPIWAGSQLHGLLQQNLVKLADSLDGYVAIYFKEKEALTNQKSNEETNMKLQGFKCVLNSKGAEETMANLAIWEPAHGQFKFRHPWKLYVKIGAAMRRCAYCIDYEVEATDQVKKHFGDACKKLSSASSKILRELADMMKNMRKSSKLDFLVFEMNCAVQELEATLKTIPIETNKPEEEDDCNDRTKSTRLHEVLPVATLLSLLIEHAARVQTTVKAVCELANRASFKQDSKQKSGGNN